MANRRRLPDLILSAKAKAESYAVKRDGKAFRLWAFVGWERGGWGRYDSFKTNEEAWVAVLGRMGLLEPEEPKPAPVPVVTPTVVWDFGGFDFGDPA